MKRHVLLSTATIILMTQAGLFGQVVTASLEGTVQDPTGAVVPSAKVRVVNNSTNLETRNATSSDGCYFAPSEQFGAITAQANGPRSIQFGLKALF